MSDGEGELVRDRRCGRGMRDAAHGVCSALHRCEVDETVQRDRWMRSANASGAGGRLLGVGGELRR